MSPQAENIGFKASSVGGLIITIVMGLSGMIAMHQAGIKSANDYTDKEISTTREYVDLKIHPINEDILDLKKDAESIKKKIESLQIK